MQLQGDHRHVPHDACLEKEDHYLPGRILTNVDALHIQALSIGVLLYAEDLADPHIEGIELWLGISLCGCCWLASGLVSFARLLGLQNIRSRQKGGSAMSYGS